MHSTKAQESGLRLTLAVCYDNTHVLYVALQDREGSHKDDKDKKDDKSHDKKKEEDEKSGVSQSSIIAQVSVCHWTKSQTRPRSISCQDITYEA